MTKLTKYVKTTEAAEILDVFPDTPRTSAGPGGNLMRRNPANGDLLFKRTDQKVS